MEMAESTGSCGRSTQSNEIEEERKIVVKYFAHCVNTTPMRLQWFTAWSWWRVDRTWKRVLRI